MPSFAIVLASLAAIVALAYLGISALAAERLSRRTNTALSGTPADYGAPYEDVRFASAVDGIPLVGWLIGAGDRPAIILLHANGGARDCTAVGLCDVARELWRGGYRVLAFDLRAHGGSGGQRMSLGLLETRDLAGAVAFLKARGVTRMGAIGFSLGADTLLNAAPDLPEIQAVVADSAFADAAQLLATELPKAGGLPSFFSPGMILMGRLMFGADLGQDRPAAAVARLGDRPLLLIHGELDSSIPLSHARSLQQAASGNPNAQWWVAPGAEHVRAFKVYPKEYMARVLSFFNKYLAGPA